MSINLIKIGLDLHPSTAKKPAMIVASKFKCEKRKNKNALPWNLYYSVRPATSALQPTLHSARMRPDANGRPRNPVAILSPRHHAGTVARLFRDCLHRFFPRIFAPCVAMLVFFRARSLTRRSCIFISINENKTALRCFHRYICRLKIGSDMEMCNGVRGESLVLHFAVCGIFYAELKVCEVRVGNCDVFEVNF